MKINYINKGAACTLSRLNNLTDGSLIDIEELHKVYPILNILRALPLKKDNNTEIIIYYKIWPYLIQQIFTNTGINMILLKSGQITFYQNYYDGGVGFIEVTPPYEDPEFIDKLELIFR